MPKEKTQNNAEQNAPVKNETQYVRKITPKLIVTSGNVVAGLKMKIAGIVSSCETVTTNYGDSIKFKGQFIAINSEGVEFRASQMYAPSILEDHLLTGFDLAKEGEQCEFAAQIGTIVNESSKTGYEWVMSPIRAAAPEEDRIALMLQ